MLFLTYYRIDPNCFEPWIESVNNLVVIQVSDKFKFHGILRNIELDTDDNGIQVFSKQLFLVGLREYELSPCVEGILLGTTELKQKQSIFSKEFEDFPTEYADTMKTIRRELDRYCTTSLEILCWRYGINGGPPSLDSELFRLMWKLGSYEDSLDISLKGWNQIQFGVQTIGLPPTINIEIPKTYSNSPSQLLSECLHGPIGPKLIREAWRYRITNPSTSLVMAVAAAETAFKEFASDRLPETKWLLNNVQSPPLIKMIREWLENIPACKNQIKKPPKEWITQIQKAIELRNKFVHGTSIIDSVSVSDLDLYLNAIRDFIYLLDYYRGREWAKENLSNEILRELGI